MLDLPHHDGSELYVSDPTPALDDTVDVFVRVPRGQDVQALHVRTTPDADPVFADAKVDRQTQHETWWRASVRMANPDTHYRFLLDHGARGYSWLTGTGLHTRDVPDDRDFRLTTYGAAPDWATEAVVYHIFPDRFASSGQERPLPPWANAADWYGDTVVHKGPSAEKQVYGGDLPGIQQHIDHIESLGANVVYLTPFFTATSNHRYDAASFSDVDPLLGGDAALIELSKRLHDRGIRLIGDLTTNHTGLTHPWFQTAREDPTSPEHSFYYWRDAAPGYLGWCEIPTLPKLDWASDELQQRMLGVVSRWLQPPFNLDGWRIDVANMTARHAAADRNHDVARALRATMAKTRADALLLAEHGHDYTRDVAGDGWHGSMNYVGFLRPVWRWLVDPDNAPEFLGAPVPVRRNAGPDVVATMTDFLGAIPWQVRLANLNQLSSHDTARVRTVTGDPRLVEIGLALLMTMPGIPAVFAGDEIGQEGVNGEDARRPFPWKQPDQWDEQLLGTFRRLIAVRRSTAALQRGGLRWIHVGDDQLAYLRETATERILVVVSRASGPHLILPRTILGPDGQVEVLYGDAPRLDFNGVRVPGDGPAVHIWRLT